MTDPSFSSGPSGDSARNFDWDKSFQDLLKAPESSIRRISFGELVNQSVVIRSSRGATAWAPRNQFEIAATTQVFEAARAVLIDFFDQRLPRQNDGPRISYRPDLWAPTAALVEVDAGVSPADVSLQFSTVIATRGGKDGFLVMTPGEGIVRLKNDVLHLFRSRPGGEIIDLELLFSPNAFVEAWQQLPTEFRSEPAAAALSSDVATALQSVGVSVDQNLPMNLKRTQTLGEVIARVDDVQYAVNFDQSENFELLGYVVAGHAPREVVAGFRKAVADVSVETHLPRRGDEQNVFLKFRKTIPATLNYLIQQEQDPQWTEPFQIKIQSELVATPNFAAGEPPRYYSLCEVIGSSGRFLSIDEAGRPTPASSRQFLVVTMLPERPFVCWSPLRPGVSLLGKIV